MLFNTVRYAVFFAVAFFGSWGLALLARTGGLPARWGGWPRIVLLLVLSYGFYAAWDWRYLPLIFGSSTVDFLLAKAIGREARPARRKALLVATVALNLGFLGYFKYATFAAAGLRLLWSAASGEPPPPAEEAFRVLLPPVGISFFTFESMSYVIDVYRGELEPHDSYLRYLLFVSFFPHLVAGPIVRPRDLLPQLEQPPVLGRDDAGEGMFLVAVGLLKKVVVSDQLAQNLVDRVFEHPERYSAVEVLAGIYGYAVQIYCDFSGYTDIAIGSALLLGVRFPKNFDAPYTAQSLAEFWRRWHISLSTWLRDYLYVPLGGNRGSELATYRNLMITMVLGGLWHGASWTFVFWGFFHGAGLAVSRAVQRARAAPEDAAGAQRRVRTALALGLALVVAASLVPFVRRLSPSDSGGRAYVIAAAVAGCLVLSAASALLERRASLLWRAAAVLLTLHLVCLGWVFFRAPTFSLAVRVLGQLGTATTFHPNLPPVVLGLLAVGIVSHFIPEAWFDGARRRFSMLPAPAQGAALFLVAWVLHEAASTHAVPFVYFQF